ncbi:MAG: DUF5677 domain-containing protein [Patescibacteria group bacterium]|nr:DUF5677 domain-containing protein [Patescibacteria group bacterium]
MNKNQHKIIVRHLKWIDKFAYEIMSNSSIRISGQDYSKTLLFLQVTKLHTSIAAVLELVKKGYGMDAMIVVRSMLNNLISCKWIMYFKSKTRAKRFIQYNTVLRKRFLAVALKYPEQKSHFLKVLVDEKEINSSYKKIEKKFKDRYSWSDKKIWRMAKDVGLNWDYDFIYNLASSLEHSDINSLNEYLAGIDHANKRFVFIGGPTPRYVMESGITSIKYMGEGLELFIKKFQLNKNYQKRLLRFANRVSVILRKD